MSRSTATANGDPKVTGSGTADAPKAGEMERLKAEIRKLKAAVTALEKANAALKKDKATLEKANAALEKDKAALAKEKAALEKALTERDEELERRDVEILALNARVAQLDGALDDATAGNIALTAENEELKRGIVQLVTSLELVGRRAEQAEQEVEELEEEEALEDKLQAIVDEPSPVARAKKIALLTEVERKAYIEMRSGAAE